MKMAKATEKDLECALLILGQLDDMENGLMPRISHGQDGPVYPATDGEWRSFEQTNADDCEEAVKRLMDVFCKRENGGAMNRVIWGMHTLMHNDVCDPNASTLEWHPSLVAAVEARKAAAEA